MEGAMAFAKVDVILTASAVRSASDAVELCEKTSHECFQTSARLHARVSASLNRQD
jgi:hypothetical protein